MTNTRQAWLRPWHASDAPALRSAFVSTPDLATQVGDAHPSDLTRARQFIEQSLGGGETWRNWAIVEDGVAVGNVGLSAMEFRHDTAWTYYWLGQAARGRGYASQALAAVSDWAFDQALFRLELGHRVNNPASCGVALRAGYRAEGIERQKLRKGSERFDVELHARLQTDPRPGLTPLAVTSE